ncbi:MAG: GAF domain-containing protein [Armatimonadota bacterium]
MIAEPAPAKNRPVVTKARELKIKVERLMMVLKRILSASHGKYDLQRAFEDITTTLMTLVPHEAAVMMSWEDRQQNACVETFTPDDLDMKAGRYLPASSLIIEMCRGNLGTAICVDTAYSPDSLERILAANGIHSCITVPLNLQGETKYLLTLGASDVGTFDNYDAALLKKLAPHVAGCLKQIWPPAEPAQARALA